MSVLVNLMSSKGKGWNFVLSQLLVALERLFDYRLSQMAESQQAIRESWAQGAAHADEDVKDALAMGEGADGNSMSNPSALVASAHALGCSQRFDVQRRWRSIALRYFQAGRATYSSRTKCTHISDALRFVKDSLEGVLGSLVEDEATGTVEMVVQWSPPQDLFI